MRVKVSVTDRDLGYNYIKKQVDAMRGKPHVSVGIQGPEAIKPHPNAETGGTMVMIASVHEFGSQRRNIPARSYIRSTMDEKHAELRRHARRLIERIIFGRTMTVEKALNILGLKIKSLIQRKISTLSYPPLKPATIRRKGSSKPLIDTGRLRAAITHKVNKDGRSG